MKRSTALLLGVAPLLLCACSTVRPPERFPDVTPDDAPRASLGLVREADHCYVAAVDNEFITPYDVNPIAISTYRQHLLPAGRHVLSIYYRRQRNFETIGAGPRYVTVDVREGGNYVLVSNVNGPDVPYAEILRTANWRPAVLDATTREQVAIAGINR